MPDIYVHSYAGDASKGVVHFKGKTYFCAIGRGGIGLKKREGDGISPIGVHELRGVHYRADKFPFLQTNLPKRAITKQDWWNDFPSSTQYNQLLIGNAPKGHDECLWRSDNLYDIIVEIGYNDAPPISNKGSAIFMHGARKGLTPTAGCIALPLPALKRIVMQLDWDSRIVIT